MPHYEEIAVHYLEVWNEADDTRRAALADATFTADVEYVDPLTDVRGLTALLDAIAAVRQQFPGWTFRSAGTVDGHHDQLRFGWALGPEGPEGREGAQGEEPPILGFDVAALDGDGRIRRVHGFLDRVPS